MGILIYLLLLIICVVIIGENCYQNGKYFLVAAMKNEKNALLINKLLRLGFYFLNLGGTFYTTKGLSNYPNFDFLYLEEMITRLGTVLLTLGILHVFNIIWITIFSLAKSYGQDWFSDNYIKIKFSLFTFIVTGFCIGIYFTSSSLIFWLGCFVGSFVILNNFLIKQYKLKVQKSNNSIEFLNILMLVLGGVGLCFSSQIAIMFNLFGTVCLVSIITFLFIDMCYLIRNKLININHN